MHADLLHEGRKSKPRRRLVRTAIWASLFLLALTLVACVAPLPATSPAPPELETAPPAPESEMTSITIVHTEEGITVPESIPAGLRRITIQNDGEEWHASIFRRLNDDVTIEQFEAAFQENPFGSLPLTVQMGGPDLVPGTRSENVFRLEPGSYVLVDNWTQPPRMQPFVVTANDEVDDPIPTATVLVEMREHEFIMPATIQSGPQWWAFQNTGESLHLAGVIKLAEGKTLDDIAAWLDTEDGPQPWEDFAFWNVMSPGQQSWGQVDLPPGDYLILDALPDFANDGAPNFTLGMVKEIVVTE